MNEYAQKRYDEKIALVNQLNDIGEVYRFELIENKEELDRSVIALAGLIPVNVNYQDYQKQFSFFLAHNLPYVRYNTQKEVEAKYTKPQNVGVLSQTKIKAWVEYLIQVYEDLVKLSQERVQKIADFEAEMVKLGATIGNKDSYGCFDGTVVKNGIEFKFTVGDEGYISKHIEVHYTVDDTTENFNMLSNNKYK